MKKVLITYGIISGAIVSVLMWGTIPLAHNGTVSFENGMVIGYSTMVIALSMVFFGIKTYRDQHLGGAITFGQAFKVGILISLIASVLYCISWEIYYNTMAPDFLDKYAAHSIQDMKDDGATEAELQEATAEMAKMAEMYKNPIVRFGFTLVEILPVAIIITLISATLLRRPDFMAQKAST